MGKHSLDPEQTIFDLPFHPERVLSGPIRPLNVKKGKPTLPQPTAAERKLRRAIEEAMKDVT